MLLLEPLQDAYVGDAEGAAAFHGYTNFQARFGPGLRCLRLLRRSLRNGKDGEHEEQKETKARRIEALRGTRTAQSWELSL